MRDERCWAFRFLIPGVLIAGLLTATADGLRAQPYPAVTDDDVPALKFNHYFTPDNKYHQPDFEWSFTKTEFVIKKGKGAIPDDLLKKLLPDGATADEIRGKWKLEGKDGPKLVLSEIKAGDKPGREVVRLVIFRSAPTGVCVGWPQYGFVVERRPPG